MPLFDLTTITPNRSFAGIRCPACSGTLETATGKESLWSRLRHRGGKSRIRYRCIGCRKSFVLTQTGL